MKTEDILKWGAIAIAGWWLVGKLSEPGGLQNLLGGGAGVQPQPQPQPQLPPAGERVVDQNGKAAGKDEWKSEQVVSTLPTVAAQMAALPGPGQMVNFDTWNYYYQQTTNNLGPSPESVGVQRTAPMPAITIVEWVNAVQGTVDLSGLRGMGRVLSAIQANGGVVQ